MASVQNGGQHYDDMMTEPNQAMIDSMQEVMALKAEELFRMCDKESKGYITKPDMQRLLCELPVTQDQLELVFDSLDVDGNGSLSLEEFTVGFGSFLGLRSQHASRDDEADDEGMEEEQSTYEGQSGVLDPAMEEKQFAEMMRHISAGNVFNDEEVIQAMWLKLHREEPDMASTFEDFLSRLSTDIRRSKVDFQSLESALMSKNNEHEEEVKKLYEEMELQIKQERERILSEEKAKERHLKADLDEQLTDKERQLQEILAKHQEMEQKMEELNKVESMSKLENERLQKEKDFLEEMLSQSRDDLEESRTYIQQMQLQQKDEKRERARAALMLSEGIAIERESLVKQLDVLKDVNKKLRDDKDEAEATDARRAESTEAAGQRERDSNSKHGGRNELCKQGSVLSNYFPGERPPKQRSAELASVDLDLDPTLEHKELDDVIDDEDEDVDVDALREANVFFGDDSGKSARSHAHRHHHHQLHHRDATSASRDSVDEPDSAGDVTRKRAAVHRQRLAAEMTSVDLDPDSTLARKELDLEVDDVGLDADMLREANVFYADDSGKSPRTYFRHHRTGGGGHRQRGKQSSHGRRSQPVGADSHTGPAEGAAAKPQRLYKVVFIGDSGVGKSSFIFRFCHHEFKSNFSATIGVDFQIKTVETETTTAILQLWDTAGQERFRSMTKSYFRKADGVVIMYDVTLEKTFTSVRNWMSSVQEQVEPGTVVVLLGNKKDIAEEDGYSPVKEKDGMLLAAEVGAVFFETSAKSGGNVTESMDALIKLLQEKEDKKLADGLKLTNVGTKKGCCGR